MAIEIVPPSVQVQNDIGGKEEKLDAHVRAVCEATGLSEAELLRALTVAAYRTVSEIPVDEHQIKRGIDAPRARRKGEEDAVVPDIILPSHRDVLAYLLGMKVIRQKYEPTLDVERGAADDVSNGSGVGADKKDSES